MYIPTEAVDLPGLQIDTERPSTQGANLELRIPHDQSTGVAPHSLAALFRPRTPALRHTEMRRDWGEGKEDITTFWTIAAQGLQIQLLITKI